MGDLHNDGDYRGHISITYQEITPGAVNTPAAVPWRLSWRSVERGDGGRIADRREPTAANRPAPPAGTPAPADRRQTKERTDTRAASSTRPTGKAAASISAASPPGAGIPNARGPRDSKRARARDRPAAGAHRFCWRGGGPLRVGSRKIFLGMGCFFRFRRGLEN